MLQAGVRLRQTVPAISAAARRAAAAATVCTPRLSAPGLGRLPGPATASSAPAAAQRWRSSTPGAVRGMHDVYGEEAERRRAILLQFASIVSSHGYRELATPMVEHVGVFARSLGDGSDVVMKEMFQVVPPAGHGGEASAAAATAAAAAKAPAAPEEMLTLRPEGTAGAVRALITSGLVRQLPQRLFYAGPMFRHERPQRGRFRQFHQAGVELIGGAGSDAPAADAEVIAMAHTFLLRALTAGLSMPPGGSGPEALLQQLGLRLVCRLNSLGDPATLTSYAAALKGYFQGLKDRLSPDSLLRLQRGAVLRILDSKHPDDQQYLADAPALSDFLSPEAAARFARVKEGLAALGVPCALDPLLVRGLDYYRHTIWEFVVEDIGPSQIGGGGDGDGAEGAGAGAAEAGNGQSLGHLGTVLAGGRYDGLVEQLGGPAGIPCIGWAAGLERLSLINGWLAEQQQLRMQQQAVAGAGAAGAGARAGGKWAPAVAVLPLAPKVAAAASAVDAAAATAAEAASASAAASAISSLSLSLGRQIREALEAWHHSGLAKAQAEAAAAVAVASPFSASAASNGASRASSGPLVTDAYAVPAVVTLHAGSNAKKQIGSAAKVGASCVVLIGPGELAGGYVTVKDLRTGQQWPAQLMRMAMKGQGQEQGQGEGATLPLLATSELSKLVAAVVAPPPAAAAPVAN